MISSLRLQNFRSYRDNSFEFGNGVNIVVGPNASGKTNLLEAVLVIAQGRSYRAGAGQLLKIGKNWARVDAGFINQKRTLKITDDGLEFLVNTKAYKRLPASQAIPVVLFEPNHLQLITSEPAKRREWLDGLTQSINPSHKKILSGYRRTLTQRNALLKQHPANIRSQIFAWDVRLSELGGLIASARAELIEQINKKISKPYSHIAARRQAVGAKYLSQFPPNNYSSKLLDKLGKSLELDIARGFTGSGPHREDIQFFLNGQPLNETASRGETRSLMMSLKVLEKDFLEKASETKPIFLLDDVFSELDGSRRKLLVDYLKDYQVVVTTTDADSAIEYFGKNHQLIPL